MEYNEPNLYRGRDYVLNEHITLHHPTLQQIFDYGEQKYWNFISLVCATPSDLKHQLFDNFGRYFNEVDEFELFCMICGGFDKKTSSIIFGELNFQTLSLGTNPKINSYIIFDPSSDLVIDSVIYTIITEYIRKINGLKKNIEIPGTIGTRDFLIEESRINAGFNSNKEFKSILLPIISTLVNCADFKYNYDNVWEMPIYAFLDSVKRIQHTRNIGYTMTGIYNGNIDISKINRKELDMFGEV